jgi:xanthine dehydrogenase small subunit
VQTIKFILNGTERSEARVPPTTTVLNYLRDTLRLTGTKEGCAEGDCGACTVLVGRPNGESLQWQPVNSCLMLVPQLAGAALLTIEGLGRGGVLSPAQRALMESDGTQCGFCTPGFVMAIEALRRTGEPPHDDVIHDALAGNLCRCTGYRPIVEACRRALAEPSDAETAGEQEDAAALTHSVPPAGYEQAGRRWRFPRSLDELFIELAEDPQARLIAGATDLGLLISKASEPLPSLISTERIDELRRIDETDDTLTLGAAVTYAEALPRLDAHFPSFAAIVRRIGSRQIRALGTFGGNLGTASPIGETLPCLMALGAAVELRSRTGARQMSVDDFITGYRMTGLRPGEVIASITLPKLKDTERFVAYKLSKRFDQDISTVIAAFRLRLEGAKVGNLTAAYGGMGPKVSRAPHLEEHLLGRAWRRKDLDGIAAALGRDFAPMDDHRGSATYRLTAAANLVRRLWHETTTEAPTRLEAL